MVILWGTWYLPLAQMLSNSILNFGQMGRNYVVFLPLLEMDFILKTESEALSTRIIFVKSNQSRESLARCSGQEKYWWLIWLLFDMIYTSLSRFIEFGLHSRTFICLVYVVLWWKILLKLCECSVIFPKMG